MTDLAKPGYAKGDVVLVSFPYTTDEGTTQVKRRPAVVVSNNELNDRLEDVIVAPITSNTRAAAGAPTAVIIAMSSPSGQAGGLRLDSVVDCSIIATIPQALLVAKIGHFPDETMQQIQRCIDSRLG